MSKTKHIFFTPFRLGVVLSLFVSYCGFWVNGYDLSTKLFIGGGVILAMVLTLCIDWDEEIKEEGKK